jgi:hypothetical protein
VAEADLEAFIASRRATPAPEVRRSKRQATSVTQYY